MTIKTNFMGVLLTPNSTGVIFTNTYQLRGLSHPPLSFLSTFSLTKSLSPFIPKTYKSEDASFSSNKEDMAQVDE